MKWPLLSGLSEGELQRVLSSARRRTFTKGEVIFHEGDPGDTLHLISRGRVAVRVTTPLGEVATLLILGAGEFFGELALLHTDKARTATVMAMEATETLSILREEFDALRKVNPQVTEMLVQILAEKVRRYSGHLLEALYIPADGRVLRQLVSLAEAYSPDRSGPVEIPLTQQDLAGLAGTSRATVNRVLREEQGRGTVKLSRSRTVVLDADSIAKRVHSTFA
ncbi:MAG TPA: Crp/Fnr family transcriptional regulator [Actinomycetota bacterium]|nr:Crp/Fnr family transcriptional regulator [Actinomycetota bacterium]